MGKGTIGATENRRCITGPDVDHVDVTFVMLEGLR